jgi:hypothetical protein
MLGWMVDNLVHGFLLQSVECGTTTERRTARVRGAQLPEKGEVGASGGLALEQISVTT